MADDLSVVRGAGPDRLPFVADDSRAAAPWRPKCGRRCGPGARLSGPSGRATGRARHPVRGHVADRAGHVWRDRMGADLFRAHLWHGGFAGRDVVWRPEVNTT